MEKEALKHHLIEAAQASLAEAQCDEDLARHLHAATRMRLINMSEDELWEMAVMLAIPQGKPVQQVSHGFKQAIEEHKATMPEWIGDL
jgi:alkylhydroperoxidase/carboxymuconolactone decarboxylase family protein YurZ